MKRAILLVAYGAGNASGLRGLREFENFCRGRFRGIPVRWAYTSSLIRERMVRQRQKSDSVRKALMRLHYEKFEAVCVQPLQTICGHEHEDVCASTAEVMRETGLYCSVGAPLLSAPEDADMVARALLKHIPLQRMSDEDVVFMGHGARHCAGALYEVLGHALMAVDAHVHLGAMNGITCLDDILPRLSSRRVWLMPLLSIIGKHALADMAGEGPASWRSRIIAAGHVCVPVLHGTAEYVHVAQIWLNHLQTAACELDG